jgi:cyclic pyranopterin phosphate synthase
VSTRSCVVMLFQLYRNSILLSCRRTSDLIPLCHPLPLDRVKIDIQLVGNNAIIECECRVTHKTGVEMEALTGASIAALTIYDMVKAVSHRVEIGKTALVSKSGGKSDFVQN